MQKIITALIVVALLAGCAKWESNYGLKHNELFTPNAIPGLLMALDDDNPSVRIKALRCLTKQKEIDRQHIPTKKILLILQNDKNANVRAYAANSLRFMLLDQDIKKEIKLVAENDSNENVRRNALKTVNWHHMPKKEDRWLYLDINEGKNIGVKITPDFSFFNGHKNVNLPRQCGLLPLKIRVNNKSDVPISIKVDGIKLQDISGHINSPLSINEVIRRGKLSYKGNIISTIVFAPVGIIGIAKTTAANKKIESVLKASIFSNLEVKPNTNSEGYVFFNVDKSITDYTGFKLALVVKSASFSNKISLKFNDNDSMAIGTTISDPSEYVQNLSDNEIPKIGGTGIKLAELQQMLNTGLINESEYRVLKERILAGFVKDTDPSP